MRRKSWGFTLIELMITVAIIGIIASIAYPSYKNAQVKNRRSMAQSTLLDIAQRQQQYLMDNRSFASAANATEVVSRLGVVLPSQLTTYYGLEITASSSLPPAFTATATPTGAQASDGALSINQNGTKSPSNKW